MLSRLLKSIRRRSLRADQQDSAPVLTGRLPRINAKLNEVLRLDISLFASEVTKHSVVLR